MQGISGIFLVTWSDNHEAMKRFASLGYPPHVTLAYTGSVPPGVHQGIRDYVAQLIQSTDIIGREITLTGTQLSQYTPSGGRRPVHDVLLTLCADDEEYIQQERKVLHNVLSDPDRVATFCEMQPHVTLSHHTTHEEATKAAESIQQHLPLTLKFTGVMLD